jgi:hypothetical protein
MNRTWTHVDGEGNKTNFMWKQGKDGDGMWEKLHTTSEVACYGTKELPKQVTSLTQDDIANIPLCTPTLIDANNIISLTWDLVERRARVHWYNGSNWETVGTPEYESEVKTRRMEATAKVCDGLQVFSVGAILFPLAVGAAPELAAIATRGFALAKKGSPLGAVIGGGGEAVREISNGEPLNPRKIIASTVQGAIMGGGGKAAVQATTFRAALLYSGLSGVAANTTRDIISGDGLSASSTITGGVVGLTGGIFGYGTTKYLEGASQYGLPLGNLPNITLPVLGNGGTLLGTTVGATARFEVGTIININKQKK